MPIIGQPMSTTKTPPKNETLAFILCLWKKKFNVLHGPITHAKPEINRSCKLTQVIAQKHIFANKWVNDRCDNLTFPMASKPLSNSSNTPRNKKEIPNPAKPTPISEIQWNYKIKTVIVKSTIFNSHLVYSPAFSYRVGKCWFDLSTYFVCP